MYHHLIRAGRLEVARKLGRNAYRRDLIAEFDALFPPQLFRGLPSHGNRVWTPRRVVWVSLIMFWVSGNTLEEQFSAARRIMKFLRRTGESRFRIRGSLSRNSIGGRWLDRC